VTTRAELIEQYERGPHAVANALVGVDFDVSPEGWTPRQVVHHLADATRVAGVRLRRLLAEDGPAIASYDEAHYADVLHYERPIDAALEEFRATVASSVELLNALTEDEWERTGTHDEFGPYSIDMWLERQATHVREHAEQIKRCRPKF
jgi:hypothetical protein